MVRSRRFLATLGLVTMALVGAACSAVTQETGPMGSPVALAEGEAACEIAYGDDAAMVIGPVTPGDVASGFASDDTAFTLMVADIVELHVEKGGDSRVIGLSELTEKGVTFTRDPSFDGEDAAYTITCWRA
ncbi:hypothetical protein MNBD_ACTINO01-1052 [hydrothermal vent metagenome]|uniref:Lipoprotein n=1 Tax=hydrothermal vent metagenome TaxID=652676 RepID=A0A3B0SU64_9ZZZZ